MLRFSALYVSGLLGLVAGGLPIDLSAAEDHLPSWNEGPKKQAILAFVADVTNEDSDHFVEASNRIAVFDNDGTLWPENPLPFQLAYALDEIKRLAPAHPEWSDDKWIQAALANNRTTLAAGGHEAIAALIAASHAGISTEEFASRVKSWLRAARHPRFGRPYNELTYQPMIEVLELLRAHGFRTYIVSGGGVEFMRVWAEEAYGIPPEQVIGSYLGAEYSLGPEGPVILKTSEVEFFDDKAAKPVAIHRFIGRRPVAAFGNSDGDKQMLEWTTIGRPGTFGLIVHHTDDQREYAYDANPKSSGRLVEALADSAKRGWVVVDMKRDWKRVFNSQ